MTLRWVPGWNGLTEPEAVSYVAAVEAADGQDLEFGVAKAINDFVLGCKNDGIWDAIKACCILAGARTLNGALVPLVGTAPTNFNFVAGDYNRETGLKGDGSTKYLNSNRLVTSDPIDNCHVSSFCTEGSVSLGITPDTISEGRIVMVHSNPGPFIRLRSIASDTGTLDAAPPSFAGASRSSINSLIVQSKGSSQVILRTANPTTGNRSITPFLFGVAYFASRLSFYSIGESLDLAALDARVSNLMTAIGAAIP